MISFLIFNPQFLFAKILHGYESKHCYTSLHSRIAGNACLSLPKIVLYDLSHCCSLIIYIYIHTAYPINLPLISQYIPSAPIISPLHPHSPRTSPVPSGSSSPPGRWPHAARAAPSPSLPGPAQRTGQVLKAKTCLRGLLRNVYIYIIRIYIYIHTYIIRYTLYIIWYLYKCYMNNYIYIYIYVCMCTIYAIFKCWSI